MSKHPSVSIIIVTHNSEAYIRQCLESVFRLTYTNFQVYLVDTDSSDKTASILDRFAHAHVTKLGKNVGFAAANNLIWEKQKAEFVLLLNPDTIVEKTFLEPLVEAMAQDAAVGAAQPVVYLLGEKKTINLTGKTTQFLGFDWIDGYKTTQIPKPHELISFSGSGVLLRSSMLTKIGLFDPLYFMYYEDSDLAWRMRLSGWKIMFVPTSKMYHDYKFVPQKSGLSFSTKLYFNERNRVITLLKNYSGDGLVLIAPAFLAVELGMLIVALFQGWLGAKFKSYGSILLNFPQILKHRAQTQKLRSVADRNVSRNYASAITFELFQHPLVTHLANPVLSAYWSLIKDIV